MIFDEQLGMAYYIFGLRLVHCAIRLVINFDEDCFVLNEIIFLLMLV
jgi:hypothetical protein